MQDTCTGFLLGGVGEMDAKRQPNFLVVRKGVLYYSYTYCIQSFEYNSSRLSSE